MCKSAYLCVYVCRHRQGGSLGELNHKIVLDQFERLRQGDSWWYERSSVLDAATLLEVQGTLFVSRVTSVCALALARFLVPTMRHVFCYLAHMHTLLSAQCDKMSTLPHVHPPLCTFTCLHPRCNPVAVCVRRWTL